MRAELLTIGTELLNGATVNTNAAYLGRRLAEVGIRCERHTAVGDERVLVCGAVEESLRRADLLVITGGLGPTFDDVTMEALADVTQRPLRVHAPVAASIRRFYTRGHRLLQRAALRQASLPEGGIALPNPLGTAPGLWMRLKNGVLVVALPGVPAEMRAIMARHVMPRLRRATSVGAIESRTLRTVGLVELSIEAVLRTLRIPSHVQLGLYPQLRMVDVRLTATAPTSRAARAMLARVERPLRRRLGRAVYGADEDTLEAVVGRLLTQRRASLAVAESCTGGLLCDRLTNVSGSSRYVRGGIVAYHNRIKHQQLGVPKADLRRFGAVSAPVARKMAVGVRRAIGAKIGLAITGIAGPTGGTATKPVGLVYLGLADGRRSLTQRCQFVGDRASIKAQAVQAALDWLRIFLLKKSAQRPQSTDHSPR